MEWVRIRKEDRLKVESFLRRWEWRNLYLASRYLGKQHATELFMLIERPSIQTKKTKIRGLLHDANGLILPLFANDDPLVYSELPPLPELSTPLSIVGESEDVDLIESRILLPIKRCVLYDLMMLVDVPDSLPRVSGLTISQASVKEWRLLFPLQRDYEIEEVSIDGFPFDATLCIKNLKHSLKRERILVGYLDGSAIAKIGTNARGIGLSQVGGAFTHPNYRRKGISRDLLSKLIQSERGMNRNLVLFVKKSNLAAKSLYIQSGFVEIGEFKMCYYV